MCIERRRQRGLTLIELIFFIIIVSIGLTGILSVMNVTVKSSALPVVRKQSIAFAESILEEVLSKAFIPDPTYPQPGANTCPDRALADDVDDYANCNGTASIGGGQTLGADSLGLTHLSATIAVASESVSGVTMKKVTITVAGGAETITLSGSRADY